MLRFMSRWIGGVLEQGSQRSLPSISGYSRDRGTRHRARRERDEEVGVMAEISRLPGPVADLWEWQLLGACRDADPTLFFHPEGERGPARRNRDAAAKAICATCPVMDAVPRARAGRPRAVRRVGRPDRGRPRGDLLQPTPREHARRVLTPEPASPGPDRRAPARRTRVAPAAGHATSRTAPAPSGGGRRRAVRRDRGQPGSVAVTVAVAVAAAAAGSGSFFSTTRVSVVSTIDAIDAALRSAERVTLTGSMTPRGDQVDVLAGRGVEAVADRQPADLLDHDVALLARRSRRSSAAARRRPCGRCPRRSPRHRSGRGRRRAPVAACTRAEPPPATMPSSIAARVAETASSIRCFFSLSSTSVCAPTLITQTPPASLASRSCSFSRSQSESVRSISALICSTRAVDLGRRRRRRRRPWCCPW